MKTNRPIKTTTIFADGTKSRKFDLIEVDEVGNFILWDREAQKLAFLDNVKDVRIQIKTSIWVHQERNGGTYGCDFERKVTRTGSAFRKANGTVSIECRVKDYYATEYANYDITPHHQWMPPWDAEKK
ncbi:hypothetical protein CMI37_38500 [Candidatus Pacearchaeota archaeon]|nr:hypothetical protein [Candidatus Pacearchaeota archaeon]|tara:strand:+ start:463 stop:846 length:384 start_codon:yes stop_codon:yes gene_type:complete